MRGVEDAEFRAGGDGFLERRGQRVELGQQVLQHLRRRCRSLYAGELRRQEAEFRVYSPNRSNTAMAARRHFGRPRLKTGKPHLRHTPAKPSGVA